MAFNFYEKPLITFYMKKGIFSIKFITCIILSLIPIIAGLISISQELEHSLITNQESLDFFFLYDFVRGILIFPYFRMIPVIITADVVSGEFSNKSAMILYSTGSRNKILVIKLLTLTLSILLLMVISFSSFVIITSIISNLYVSLHILLTYFFFIFIDLMFIVSLTFMFSTLTRNTITSFIVPFLYITIEPFFKAFELELLSYSYFKMIVFNFLEDIIFIERILIRDNTIISFIAFFGLPILILLITFYGFKQLDIRVD